MSYYSGVLIQNINGGKRYRDSTCTAVLAVAIDDCIDNINGSAFGVDSIIVVREYAIVDRYGDVVPDNNRPRRAPGIRKFQAGDCCNQSLGSMDIEYFVAAIPGDCE